MKPWKHMGIDPGKGTDRTVMLARVESDDRWLPIRMTPSLMRVIAETSAGGPVTIRWGKPDEDGFYTPTITVRRAVTTPVTVSPPDEADTSA